MNKVQINTYNHAPQGLLNGELTKSCHTTVTGMHNVCVCVCVCVFVFIPASMLCA